MGRYTIGRRKFSWEKGRGRQLPRRKTTGSSVAGFLIFLLLTYFFLRPVFWFFAAFLAFIAACLLLIGAINLAEWVQRSGALRRFRRKMGVQSNGK